MDLGIKIEIDWFDDDAICLHVRCSNGSFSGENYLYEPPSALLEMGKMLQGFPKSPTDVRDIELGTFDATSAGGGIRLHFQCIDRVGIAKLDIKLRGAGCKALGELDSASFSFPIEPAAIDSFVSQMLKMGIHVGSCVELPKAI
jgi:hypothetical protein